MSGRWTDGWTYAKFVQGEAKTEAKRGEFARARAVGANARLIFHAGNVTADLCLLLSRPPAYPLIHPQYTGVIVWIFSIPIPRLFDRLPLLTTKF